MAAPKSPPIVPIYGVSIHQACCSGDLGRMKAVAKQGEQYLKQHGNVPAALEALKLEIAKMEHAAKKK